MNPDGLYCAFFYGTLMHPDILKRVIGNDGTHLKICSGILLDHTRHQIKHADYPAVIPYSKSKGMFSRELSAEERSVRGSLIFGLSESDMRLLDIFEGDEYIRSQLPVHPLSAPISLSLHLKSHPSVIPHNHTPSTLPSPINADVYIWVNPPYYLKPSLWCFDDFVKNDAWKWVGTKAGAGAVDEYFEVDRRREKNGAGGGPPPGVPFIIRCGIHARV